jgi:hypothetical protein
MAFPSLNHESSQVIIDKQNGIFFVNRYVGELFHKRCSAFTVYSSLILHLEVCRVEKLFVTNTLRADIMHAKCAKDLVREYQEMLGELFSA